MGIRFIVSPTPPLLGGLDGSPPLGTVLSQEGRQSSLLSAFSPWLSLVSSRVGVLPLLREVSLGLVATVLARVPMGFESLGNKTGRGGGGGGAGILKPSSVAPPPPAAPRSLRLPVRDCVPMGGVGPAMVKSL